MTDQTSTGDNESATPATAEQPAADQGTQDEDAVQRAQDAPADEYASPTVLPDDATDQTANG